ncbi:DUF5698 domain-containing protein [Orenia marismortui]|uniref:DUF5698 domain-containing protein n=1 Tax=Orenia marismortui TaxID=46469 RepID=A0A4R8H0J5_9FIRM|nr:DUF5698 domain-containing protein [Orenia marismortui]TDX52942.1 hypothetical protein C7959_10467 [Orenia marismortui]
MVKVILWAILIFIARAIDVALGTLRVRMVVNRKKYLAAIIGFFEVLIYILIVSKVLQDTSNILNVISYCAGFSCGTILGLDLEKRLSKGILKATIMVKDDSNSLLKLIEKEEFRATITKGEGTNTRIDIINVILDVERKGELEDLVKDKDYNSLISFETIDGVKNGCFYSLKNKI